MSQLTIQHLKKSGAVEFRGRGCALTFPTNNYIVASVNAKEATKLDFTLPDGSVLLKRVPYTSIVNELGAAWGAGAATTRDNLNAIFDDVIQLELDQLDNVDTTGVTDGMSVVWDSSSGNWLAQDLAGATELSDLSDVLAASPTSGQLLGWTGSAWDAVDEQAVPSASTDLTDSGDLIRTTNTISDLSFIVPPSITGSVPSYVAGVGWVTASPIVSIAITGDSGSAVNLVQNAQAVQFTSPDGSIDIATTGANYDVEFTAKPKYTFHDAGRRQFSSSQDNFFHIGDSVYGMYDNVENFATSVISGSNTFDFYMINGWPMPVDATEYKINGFVATSSTGFLSTGLEVALYRLRHTADDDATSTLIGSNTVTMPSVGGFCVDIGFSGTTTDIAENDVLIITYRFPSASISVTSYLNYSTTLTVS